MGRIKIKPYIVFVDYGTVEVKHGPYSYSVALECAAEFKGKQTCYVIDAETGEIVKDYPVKN